MLYANWTLCQLENTNETLVSPVNDKRKDRGSGYKSLADNLPKFEEVGQLPIQLPLSYLDEGRGIEETLRFHQASWHKSCFNKCSSAKLTRAQKRKHAEVREDSDETRRLPHNRVRSKLYVPPLEQQPSLRPHMT